MTPRALARAAAGELTRRTGVDAVDAVVVLGSGWDEAVDDLGGLVGEVATTSLSGFAPQRAPGHRGLARVVDLAGRRVLVFLGRTHLFEGHGVDAVAHQVRVAAAAGASVAVLTNASGSLRCDWTPGTGVVLADHLNLTGASPLSGPDLVDLADAYSPRLRALARSAEPALAEGVYAGMRGPSVQTGAETRMLRVLGADLVGMSTVLETIAARAAGLEVLGLSAVTTVEGSGMPLDEDEVVAVARGAARDLGPVVAHVLR